MTLSGHASQASIYITTILFTILACAAVVLRLVNRLFFVRSSGWDDLFILIACIFSVAMGASICRQTYYGMGLHIEGLGKDTYTSAVRWFWSFLWIYHASLCFTKLSILLQYLRIMPHKALTKICKVMLCVVSVWTVWSVSSGIWTCSPISRFWTDLQWNAEGCLPRLPLWYSNAAVNIVTDLTIAILPLPIIHSLSIPQRQKTILTGVFLAGLFACLVSVLRCIYVYPLSVSTDMTWNAPLVTIWSCVEVNTAIVCSCVPTLKSFVQRYFPMLLDTIRPRPVTEIIPAGRGFTAESMQKGGMHASTFETAPSESRSGHGWTRYLPFGGNGKRGEEKSKWYSSSTRSDMTSGDPVSVIELGSLPSPSPFSDSNAIGMEDILDRTFGHGYQGRPASAGLSESSDGQSMRQGGSGRVLKMPAHGYTRPFAQMR